MKPKPVSIMIVGLIMWSLVGTAMAQSYTLNQYFPLVQSNTLVFSETGEERKGIAVRSVLGLELVGLVPTQTVWYWDSTSPLGWKSSSLAWNLFQGLGRHKDTHFQGIEETGYTLYDSPDILLPRDMEIGEVYEGSSSYTRYDISDTEIATGTTERELTLDGVEDVTVRAGAFSGCLKFSETVSWEEIQDTYGSWERTFWLAPGVGLIKWDVTVSETIAGQGETTEESSWELFFGYVSGELILPNDTPEAESASPVYGMAW